MQNVRYTAAKRREVAAARAAEAEARDRRQAAMPYAEYAAEAATYDLSTGAEFDAFHTAHHAELRARYGL